MQYRNGVLNNPTNGLKRATPQVSFLCLKGNSVLLSSPFNYSIFGILFPFRLVAELIVFIGDTFPEAHKNKVFMDSFCWSICPLILLEEMKGNNKVNTGYIVSL